MHGIFATGRQTLNNKQSLFCKPHPDRFNTTYRYSRKVLIFVKPDIGVL